MTVLTMGEVTKNWSGIKDIKTCHEGYKFPNLPIISTGSTGKNFTSHDRNSLSTIHWLRMNILLIVFSSLIIACWQETVSSRWKSCPESRFDKRVTYVKCQPSRHWSTTTPPSKNDTCRVLSPCACIFYGSNTRLKIRCQTLSLSLQTGWSSCDMSSFSINSILDLHDSKRCSSSTNHAAKNSIAFEELEEQVMSKEYKRHSGSPNLRPSLETDDSSYEGKLYTPLYLIVTSLPVSVTCFLIPQFQ